MKRFLAVFLILSIILSCITVSSADITEYILRAREEGIVFGDENGNLQEDKEVTRAEFLTIAARFWKLSGGENVFSDVAEDDWFCKSIAAAHFYGIFSGTETGEAKPYELIKIEDAVAIVGRYYNATDHKGRYIGISEYAEHYFGYAFENGIFSGWRYLPNAKHGITKGEVVSLFYRYQEKNEQTECFVSGYPRLSPQQYFNSLSIDIKTRTDCDISYAIIEKGAEEYSWTEVPQVQKANELKTVRITANISKIYNVYIKAVSRENGSSRMSEFADVAPLAFIRGDGSGALPYVIYTEAQLGQISVFPDKSYVLGNDIKITEKWTPVKNFSGTLDGAGYRIEDIFITDNGRKSGLFESIEGGTVKNLTVNADISAKEIAGVIAGENNGGTIDGCCVTGFLEVAGGNGGGICGINRGKVTDCLSCLYSVKAGSFAGGIAGQNSGEIKNCLSAAETVTSDMYSGGIAGTNNGGYITGCAAVNIAVYNTMTYNGGKISTNRNDGIMENNYSFSDMVSNAARTEMSANSRNGMELEWDTLKDETFYYELGWDRKKWKQAESGFRLICPKNAAEPKMEAGKTAYFPKEIATADELAGISGNTAGNYVLTRDITLRTPWKTVYSEGGFSGTLDGNGHTIYNLNLNGETGMFSSIEGGTVKNLNFSQVTAALNSDGGVISAYNHGYIENCTISGEIYTEKAGKIGVVTAENNGRIENCRVEMAVKSDKSGVIIGGICAENSGVVSKSAFCGEITANAEDAIIGGICGIDTEGYISESAAKVSIRTGVGRAVSGGVCAVSAGTQIYKCASMGEANHIGENISAGGICAEAEASTVYNCFSQEKISIKAETASAGGICAIAAGANIQNTYSSGDIKAMGKDTVVGGICAAAQESFITQNVALNPSVSARRAANAIIGEYESCEIYDNYSCQSMRKSANSVHSGEKNGTAKPKTELLTTDFYLKPLSENGFLGWDKDAWAETDGYGLPVLTDTPLAEQCREPIY